MKKGSTEVWHGSRDSAGGVEPGVYEVMVFTGLLRDFSFSSHLELLEFLRWENNTAQRTCKTTSGPHIALT